MTLSILTARWFGFNFIRAQAWMGVSPAFKYKDFQDRPQISVRRHVTNYESYWNCVESMKLFGWRGAKQAQISMKKITSTPTVWHASMIKITQNMKYIDQMTEFTVVHVPYGKKTSSYNKDTDLICRYCKSFVRIEFESWKKIYRFGGNFNEHMISDNNNTEHQIEQHGDDFWTKCSGVITRKYRKKTRNGRQLNRKASEKAPKRMHTSYFETSSVISVSVS